MKNTMPEEDIGHGVTIKALGLNGVLPSADWPYYGIIQFHRNRQNPDEDCAGTLIFDSPAIRAKKPHAQVVHVERFSPLTIKGYIKCSACGHLGAIRDGRWVPALM